jgi:hypothetical protein
VALMPRRTFEWLRGTSVPFNHYLQDLLNARLSLFIGALAHERLLDTDARVANCLASLFNPDLYPDAPRFLEVGQVEIGLLANVSRQRVNVALQRLQALQLIRLEKRGLTVLDLGGLALESERRRCAQALRNSRVPTGVSGPVRTLRSMNSRTMASTLGGAGALKDMRYFSNLPPRAVR